MFNRRLASLRVGVTLGAGLAMALLPRVGFCLWTMIDVSGSSASTSSCAQSLGPGGAFVGFISDAATGSFLALRVSPTGAVSTLPPLPGDNANRAFGIGPGGAIAGWSYNGSLQRASLYVPAFNPVPPMRGIPRAEQYIALNTDVAAGSSLSVANDVNGSAVAVGTYEPAGSTNNQAFRSDEQIVLSPTFRMTTVRVTTSLAPSLGSPTSSEARAINEAGVIVGSALRSGAMVREPFLLDAQGPIFLGAVASNSGASASDVSANGIVVGSYLSGGANHSFRWNDANGNRVVDAGEASFPGGTGIASAAHGVNQSGQVVGQAFIGTSWVAYISFTGAALVPLASLTIMPSGWTLQNAHAIDDSNRIVGCATNPSGVSRAVLLTWTPDT
jgi:hypothetical protein